MSHFSELTVEEADGPVPLDQRWAICPNDLADNNDWLAVNQFTVVGPQGHNRRADIVIFLNGLPLGVIELKNPADEKATIGVALNQLQTYQSEIPALFDYNCARRLGRHRRADRRLGRRQGVVQALAHDRWGN